MSRRKSAPYEVDDEFFAQLDFLRNDYDQALKTIEGVSQSLCKPPN